MENFVHYPITNWTHGERHPENQGLISEEPLSIRVQGNPYSVVMRTPGDEKAHVAGFCLGEGIVDSLEDIVSIGFCDGDDTNVVTVTVSATRRKLIARHLDRREYVSQTSCGICGKQIIQELHQELSPIEKQDPINIEKGFECLKNLDQYQPLREKTRCSHAAALYDLNYKLLTIAEDVGRHNALDKAIGKLLLEGTLDNAHLLVLSSRISYELVQKAARARIPIILAVSRPTALAVSLASTLNMTLGCSAKKSGLFIFCGEDRLRG